MIYFYVYAFSGLVTLYVLADQEMTAHKMGMPNVNWRTVVVLAVLWPLPVGLILLGLTFGAIRRIIR